MWQFIVSRGVGYPPPLGNFNLIKLTYTNTESRL